MSAFYKSNTDSFVTPERVKMSVIWIAQTQDQKGAVVSELDYDCRWDMTMTVIGGDGTEDPAELPNIATGDTTFTWDGKKWKIQSVQYTGNYQSKKMYQINAYRFRNFPQQVS